MSSTKLKSVVEPPEQVDLLLVDDDEGVNYLVERQLRRTNASFAWCQNGQAAYEFLQHHKVSVVLLDQRMPDCMGDELLARLTNDGLLSNTQVFVCSASRPAPAVCDRISALGADILEKADILSPGKISALLQKASVVQDGLVKQRLETDEAENERRL